VQLQRVSKEAICGAVAGGCHSVTAVMETTRAGKGCGSCKSLVAQIVEWAADGAVEEDPSVHYYVPGIPMGKPALMAEIRERGLKSASEVFAALAPEGAEDAKSKMGLASLLKMMWGEDAVDERGSRFINDRVHANIQKDGTFSVVPQMRGGVTTAEQLRRSRTSPRSTRCRWSSSPAASASTARHPQGGPAGRLGRPRHASGYAYGKSMRTVKTCVDGVRRFGTGDSTKLALTETRSRAWRARPR
jgi:nitrite reductase (NADH) large subunit